MFLITKKVKDWHYLYLVKSTRKNHSKTPKHKIIKYVGKVENYSKEDINKIKELLKNKKTDIMKYLTELKQKKNIKRKRNRNKSKRKKNKCVMCGFDFVIHLHHITPISKGGSNKKDNLICLCPNHHEMLHKGLISEKEVRMYLRENKPVGGNNIKNIK